jgi:hypothetical protein
MVNYSDKLLAVLMNFTRREWWPASFRPDAIRADDGCGEACGQSAAGGLAVSAAGRASFAIASANVYDARPMRRRW